MKTVTLNVTIPTDLFVAVNESEQVWEDWLKIATAIHFYQLQKLTIGKAAQLANLPRLEFENVLATYQIPISNLTYFDIENDIAKLRNL